MSKSIIYLDYQSTTPVDNRVMKAVEKYYTESFYNPSSSNKLGQKINSEIENARLIISKAINCDSNEIFFTSGASESINTAIKGYFQKLQNAEIITLKTEHSAVLKTCKHLNHNGVKTSFANINNDGLIDIAVFEKSFTTDTKMVSIMHVNNEIGTIQPIKDIGVICKNKNVPLFVDAAQSFGKVKIDVKEMNISMLAISGHKIYAPKGVGVIYVNKELQSKINPLIHGGGQENGFRSGTLNVPGIIGLAKATELALKDIVIEQNKVMQLRNLFLELLNENVDGFVVNGSMKHRLPSNLNISFKGVSGDVLINQLKDVYVSRGSACNSNKNEGSHVLKAIGLSQELIDSAIRISIGRFTTEAEIIKSVEIISSIVNRIRNISKL